MVINKIPDSASTYQNWLLNFKPEIVLFDSMLFDSNALELPLNVFPYRHSGLEVKQYNYYDPSTCGLDFNGMMADIAVITYFFFIHQLTLRIIYRLKYGHMHT